MYTPGKDYMVTVRGDISMAGAARDEGNQAMIGRLAGTQQGKGSGSVVDAKFVKKLLP